ncbi:MAG: glycosyltransferase [Deltaproteobacteria bacterium]|nr:glycosyltransferase [Deltaproteobacteria bacterium]
MTLPGSFEAQGAAGATPPAPSRSDVLQAAWAEYFRQLAVQDPKHPGARDMMNDDLRDALTRLIPPDASVLEVGCGRGDLLASLPHAEKAGIDFVPELIEQAQARHSNIAFSVGDVLSAPADRRFDAVVCDRLCHSVLDIRSLLSGLRERLNPGGRIYLTTFNVLWELPSRLAERAGWKVPSPTANWLSESDFSTLFDLTDLEVVRFEDRLMMPFAVPGLSALVNKYLVKAPGLTRTALYRVYVLRARAAVPQRVRVAETNRGPSVTVVVPARNEAGNIAGAVYRTPLMGAATEIIFVEGGSKDATWETIQKTIAEYKGPLQLSAYKQTGKGKGDAVRLGFSHAKGDILMILDADLTVPPEDLPVFYEAAALRRADFVQGTRLVYPMDPGAMRFFNKLGNIGFSLLFSYLLQQPIKDTLCGTKVLWRKDYERIAAGRAYFGDFDPFGDFDLIFGAARLNMKISEVPVRYRDRVYGETNIERWKHGWLLLKMSAVAARKLKFV